MEVDTGSSVTLLSSADFTKTGGQVTTLKPPTVLLKSYTGDIIQCLGEKEMDVKVGDQVGTLLIHVVQGPSLLGRHMMSKFIPVRTTQRCRSAAAVHFYGCTALKRLKSSACESLKQRTSHFVQLRKRCKILPR